MLSYRHIFHAGNHADVLKHAILVHLLRHMCLKDKPFSYVDTHAGALTHALRDPNAQKNAEFKTGITPIWETKKLAPLWAQYRDAIALSNPQGTLTRYPGSLMLALQLTRPDDRLRAFELHSTESTLLARSLRPYGKRILLQAGDGFAGMKSALPPPSRRGLALIDPSYEDKRDYGRVVATVKDALTRFATGTYAVWYPMVSRIEPGQLVERLSKLGAEQWLHVQFRVAGAPRDGHGLFGSGMFVINPPYTLRAMLTEALPELLDLLGQDDHATWNLDWKE